MLLAAPLGAPLGADISILGVEVETNHAEDAIKRLPQQFRGKPLIEGLLRRLVAQADDLELALAQLLALRSVDTAAGTQLDDLGVIVGQERGGLVDTDYRRYIRARIMANRSRGNVEDMIRVMNLVINDDDVTIEIESQRGGAAIRLRGIITSDALADIVLEFAKDSKSGGIRVFVESYFDVDAELFTIGRCAFGNGATLVGATSLPINTTITPAAELLAFPETGSLILDEGLATQETVSYSFRGFSGGVYKFTSSACANAHSAGFTMTLTGSVAGKGLGSSADVGQPALLSYQNIGTTGGRLADVRE